MGHEQLEKLSTYPAGPIKIYLKESIHEIPSRVFKLTINLLLLFLLFVLLALDFLSDLEVHFLLECLVDHHSLL